MFSKERYGQGQEAQEEEEEDVTRQSGSLRSWTGQPGARLLNGR
jgi:hypothetical protein